jgi:hypothetical protein
LALDCVAQRHAQQCIDTQNSPENKSKVLARAQHRAAVVEEGAAVLRQTLLLIVLVMLLLLLLLHAPG